METYKCQRCNGTGISIDEDLQFLASYHKAYNYFDKHVDNCDDHIVDGVEYEDRYEYAVENRDIFIDLITPDECPCDGCNATGEVDWVTNCMDNRIAA